MTLERVIYARRGGLALEAPHRPLGSAGEGAWAAVSDETLQALLAAQRPLRILYFGADEYAHAMRGLGAPDVERAVRRRLEVFSDRVAAETLAALMERERRSLAIAAAGGQRGYVDDCLARLARLNGRGYFDTMALVEAVRISVVAEVALQEAEAEAGNAAAAARRRSQAEELAEARARLGEPAFTRGLPFVDPIAVFAVSPVKRERLEVLDHKKVPYAVLDGRLLVALPRRRGADLASDGAVTRVAADAGDFVIALDQTDAQRDRDLRELVSHAGDGRADDAARWRQRAAQCAVKRWLVDDRRCDAALVSALRTQLDADVAELMTSAPPPPGGETLAESHARATADARLFARLARQGDLPALADDFDDTLARLSAAGV